MVFLAAQITWVLTSRFLSKELETVAATSAALAESETRSRAEIEKLKKDIAKLEISAGKKKELNESLQTITTSPMHHNFATQLARIGSPSQASGILAAAMGSFGISGASTLLSSAVESARREHEQLKAMFQPVDIFPKTTK